VDSSGQRSRPITAYHTQGTAEGSVFCCCQSGFLFVYEIYWEPLNGCAPNSHGRRMWCLTPMSLNAKVTRDKNGIFWPFRRPACGLCLVKHL